MESNAQTRRGGDMETRRRGDAEILSVPGPRRRVTVSPRHGYGVDRATRMNVPGYGNREREGQFLFPLHVQQTTYRFWDPFYLGPRVATFDHVEQLEGLTVYAFNYTATDTDDTDGFTFLADVPERYRALSNGKGRLWIEPTSGLVVDFEDEGVTDFVDPTNGTPVAELYFWSARYTPETRLAQLQLASTARLRILALEDWLPAGLLLVGLVWLAIGFRLPKFSKTSEVWGVEQHHETSFEHNPKTDVSLRSIRRRASGGGGHAGLPKRPRCAAGSHCLRFAFHRH